MLKKIKNIVSETDRFLYKKFGSDKSTKSLENIKEAQVIFSHLNQIGKIDEVRFVGGCVRKAISGEDIDDIDRPQLIVCSVDEDRQAALDAARLLLTQYLGQQPHIMAASGVSEELLNEIHQVLSWPATNEEVRAASKLVPDDVVQRCTASGTPEEAKTKVQEYIDAGCTSPILYPLGPDVQLMIDTFSEWE